MVLGLLFITPGVRPPNFNVSVDINDFHCSFGHVHEGLLRETAKQRNVNLTGGLRECQGCSIAKADAYFDGDTSIRVRGGRKNICRSLTRGGGVRRKRSGVRARGERV